MRTWNPQRISSVVRPSPMTVQFSASSCALTTAYKVSTYKKGIVNTKYSTILHRLVKELLHHVTTGYPQTPFATLLSSSFASPVQCQQDQVSQDTSSHLLSQVSVEGPYSAARYDQVKAAVPADPGSLRLAAIDLQYTLRRAGLIMDLQPPQKPYAGTPTTRSHRS